MSNFIDQNIWRQQLQTEQGSLQLQHSKYQIQQSSLLHYKQPHKKWVKDFYSNTLILNQMNQRTQ